MGLRQREWARKKRDEMIAILGGKCKECGTTEKLEFDVIIPVGNEDHHRKYEWSRRMSFYRKQLDMNNLQLLCSHHNKLKYNKLLLQSDLPVEAPF